MCFLYERSLNFHLYSFSLLQLDGGFKPGRQFGRGKGGGQVRDNRKFYQQQQQQAFARRESGEKRRRDSGGGGYREIRMSRDSRGYDGDRRGNFGGSDNRDHRANDKKSKEDKNYDPLNDGLSSQRRQDKKKAEIVIPSFGDDDDDINDNDNEDKESGPAKKRRTEDTDTALAQSEHAATGDSDSSVVAQE